MRWFAQSTSYIIQSFVFVQLICCKPFNVTDFYSAITTTLANAVTFLLVRVWGRGDEEWEGDGRGGGRKGGRWEVGGGRKGGGWEGGGRKGGGWEVGGGRKGEGGGRKKGIEGGRKEG